MQESIARPIDDVGVDLSDPRRILEAALDPPRPAGGGGPHERRVSLGVPRVDAAVLPRQGNLPQLVGVVPLGQQVEEAGLAGVCIVLIAMFNTGRMYSTIDKQDLLLNLSW